MGAPPGVRSRRGAAPYHRRELDAPVAASSKCKAISASQEKQITLRLNRYCRCDRRTTVVEPGGDLSINQALAVRPLGMGRLAQPSAMHRPHRRGR
jgi:hypothetical protein